MELLALLKRAPEELCAVEKLVQRPGQEGWEACNELPNKTGPKMA